MRSAAAIAGFWLPGRQECSGSEAWCGHLHKKHVQQRARVSEKMTQERAVQVLMSRVGSAASEQGAEAPGAHCAQPRLSPRLHAARLFLVSSMRRGHATPHCMHVGLLCLPATRTGHMHACLPLGPARRMRRPRLSACV